MVQNGPLSDVQPHSILIIMGPRWDPERAEVRYSC